jgi:site-specific recombinase XerD
VLLGKLTIRTISAAKPAPGKTVRLWDDDPRGFGVYVKPSGVKSFFVQYRSPLTQKKRRYTMGKFGTLTLEQARREGRVLLAQVARGEDPLAAREQKKKDASTAITVSEFCELYMADAEDGVVTYRGKPKRPSTLVVDRGRVERHIKPTLGAYLVRDIVPQDVEDAYHDIRRGKTAVDVKTGPRGRSIVTGGAGTAARTVGLLGSIFSYAKKRGIRDDNPVTGMQLPSDRKRDRILSPEEYKRMGDALIMLENKSANPIAIRAVRALALTGCRRGEIYRLKKLEIDQHNSCLRLGDTKTGQQVRPIGRAAMELLMLPIFKDESPYVFPATHGDKFLTDAKVFMKVRDEAKLEGVSLHTLRHSFASVALELEYSELTIAGLLGHRAGSITARYAHSVDRSLVAAANRVSSLIASRINAASVEDCL